MTFPLTTPRSDLAKLRVMLIDDSAVVRGLTKRWVTAEADFDLVAVAVDGEDGVKQAPGADPDVIILDVEMPHMDGLTALPLLRKSVPRARIIMASTLTRRGAETTMRALARGAADYIAKPEAGQLGGAETYRIDLVEKVRVLGQAAARSARASLSPSRPTPNGASAVAPPHAPAALRGGPPAPQASAARPALTGAPIVLRPALANARKPDVLVVASSTGGPQALQQFLAPIAGKISQPILIVQHMPATFTAILAEHLQQALKIPCAEARHDEPVLGGRIYIAPGDWHMRIVRRGVTNHIALDQGPQVNYCRPAADPLFETASSVWRDRVLGVVLTGMGQDGRIGSEAIVANGGRILAQDEASSVVWGMPGAVARAGVCSAIEPLSQLGPKVMKMCVGA